MAAHHRQQEREEEESDEEEEGDRGGEDFEAERRWRLILRRGAFVKLAEFFLPFRRLLLFPGQDWSFKQ